MSMFQDARGFHISGGQFNSAVNHIYSADPLHPLWLAIKDVGAGHNSGTRYPPPRCHPDTRRDVIHVLHEWIHSPSLDQRIMWLYGPAGAGKSAIAQTMAETGQTEGYLVSSFFFSRGDPRRGIADSLCLCIAYGLAIAIPELWDPITQAIKRDPAILQATLKEQLEKLIVEPFQSLEQLYSHPWLVVIDGLDECKGSWDQQDILSLLATVFPKQIPLRFLICSRPEPHIREAFDADGFRPYLYRVALDETFESGRDITTFLNSEFKRISTHPRNQHISFPNPWPEPGVVYELVHKASGQFVYAATVIKFVDNEYSNPCTQLEQVLRPTVGRNLEMMSSPFYDLDVLYHQILSSNAQRSKVRDVIWTLVLLGERMTLTPETIEVFLFLPKGDVIPTLRGMHSILNVGGPGDEIQIFHASFGDFLRDESRSGYFFLGGELEQKIFLACRTCCVLERYSDKDEDDRGCPKYNELVHWRVFLEAWRTWGDYCSKSDLNHEVLNFLQTFDFSIGFNIQDRGFLLYRASPVRSLDNSEKRMNVFFLQAEALLQRLRMDPASYNDIIHRFSDYRRGFIVRVSRAGVPDMALSGILEDVTHTFGSVVTGSTLLGPFPWVSALSRLDSIEATPQVQDLDKFHFRIISIGNDCCCTRASSRLSLRCSESTSSDLYHIQFSVALRERVGIALRYPGDWYTDDETGRLVCRMVYDTQTRTLCELLDICGPAPELLDSLPNVFPRIRSLRDKEEILRWLQSFPSEYISRTLHLIEQVRKIVPPCLESHATTLKVAQEQ